LDTTTLHLEVKTSDRFLLKTPTSLVYKFVACLVEVSLMSVFNRNRSQVFTSKCGPSAMSSPPGSSSSSRYHEVDKKEVSRMIVDGFSDL